MKRYIISVDRTTTEVKDKITEALKSNNFGFWHWYQNLWLVIDAENRGVIWWRDWIKKISSDLHVLVLETDSPAWSAFGQAKEFDWFRNNWEIL